MSGKNNNLTPKEQKTTAAFKLISAENSTIKKSLKRTQDELEKMRDEKFQQEKINAVLENKQKILVWIEIFKFLSSAGVGFATNYYFIHQSQIALMIGIPSLVIFLVTILVSKR